jgi:hypothetical protein
MNNKFDELAKGLAESVTRRQALKRFGASLAGMALACFGLANRAEGGTKGGNCDPPKWCTSGCCCKGSASKCTTGLPTCNPYYSLCAHDCAVEGAIYGVCSG